MSANDEHYRRLERMYAAAPINEYFRPVLKISAGSAEVIIAMRPDFFHAAQAAHGAIYFKAMDDAAFFAVNSIVTDVFVLTVSFNVFFTRPVSAGQLRAVARVTHRSKRMFLADAELFDADGKLAGRGTGSFMRSELALTALEGYR